MVKLDILAFGAHPDDVEIGMGATLAKYVEAGYRVGICDLTKAELSSNGTVELRQKEAKRAGEILGLTTRIQLTLPDRGLKVITKEQLAEVVSIIRTYKPAVVFAPFPIDRHPDHGACTDIVKEACFNAGIKRYQCADDLHAFRPDALHFYFINGYEHPDFVIDVTHFIEKKKQALLAYESQFVKTSDSIDTPLTNDYITVVDSRERLFGKEVGVTYAEGFKTMKPIIVSNLFAGGESNR
ncbi:bacillithiol biosynthesis deacetylase BshB1 [Halalkalibacter kiskunsagensis]|uniref:Bacillithiol biosynthesis deacetylase BshB1 n=1 Tax=Halalkalibacter kiskunsagensis TaxID=1548599 RepID=A0ABV6KAB3_9BACI